MKHYILTSPKFAGSIEYKYCDEGYLTWFSYQATMSSKQREYALTKMPLTINGFQDLIGNSDTLKVEEILLDFSFDAFWESYANKINRKRCEPIYNKLTNEKKLQCIKSIASYKRYLRKTNFRNEVDPENYLKREMYLNDWNKL